MLSADMIFNIFAGTLGVIVLWILIAPNSVPKLVRYFLGMGVGVLFLGVFAIGGPVGIIMGIVILVVLIFLAIRKKQLTS